MRTASRTARSRQGLLLVLSVAAGGGNGRPCTGHLCRGPDSQKWLLSKSFSPEEAGCAVNVVSTDGAVPTGPDTEWRCFDGDNWVAWPVSKLVVSELGPEEADRMLARHVAQSVTQAAISRADAAAEHAAKLAAEEAAQGVATAQAARASGLRLSGFSGDLAGCNAVYLVSLQEPERNLRPFYVSVDGLQQLQFSEGQWRVQRAQRLTRTRSGSLAEAGGGEARIDPANCAVPFGACVWRASGARAETVTVAELSVDQVRAHQVAATAVQNAVQAAEITEAALTQAKKKQALAKIRQTTFRQMLANCLSPDGPTRAAAERKLATIETESTAVFFVKVAQELASEDCFIGVRQQAGLRLCHALDSEQRARRKMLRARWVRLE